MFHSYLYDIFWSAFLSNISLVIGGLRLQDFLLLSGTYFSIRVWPAVLSTSRISILQLLLEESCTKLLLNTSKSPEHSLSFALLKLWNRVTCYISLGMPNRQARPCDDTKYFSTTTSQILVSRSRLREINNKPSCELLVPVIVTVSKNS